MPTNFKKQCLPQSNSRLMQLPPELLLMILELCVKPLTPLRPLYGPGDGEVHLPKSSERSYIRMKPLRKGMCCGKPGPPRRIKPEAEKRQMEKRYSSQFHQFSAQIFRCCQRLYNVAWPILYNNCELTIFCDEKYISMLNTRFPKIELSDTTCWPAAYITVNDVEIFKDHMKIISPFVKSFQKINVIIEHSLWTDWHYRFRQPPYTHLAISAIGIRHLLYGKDVRVQIYMAPPDSEGRHVEGYPTGFKIEGSKDHNAVQVFNFWRCRSLAFYDMDLEEQDKTSVIEAVTSDRPIYDLVNSYEQFQTEIAKESRKDKDCALIRDAMINLAAAAYSADDESFLRGREEVAKMAEEMGRKDIAKLLKRKVGLWPADPTKKKRLNRPHYQLSTI